ncbi:HAD family hydrolase [Leptodesmis sp.]|uniref:HAD family hydrolase n=1 Tax=Leptodesmis sp. TaxID=3100501 RepID=UPI0040535167
MPIIQCGDVQFQNIQAVLFDKDGTLANVQAFLCKLGQQRANLLEALVPGVSPSLLQAFGVEGDRLNPAGLLAVGTRLENEVAAAAYVAQTGWDWMESLHQVRSAFLKADQFVSPKAHHTPLFTGALAVLQDLANAGIKIGIVSSDSPLHVQQFVEYYQLEPLVQVALGSYPDLSKPDPRLVYQACQILEVSPSVTLVVGDSSVDVEMAGAAATVGCVGVGWGGVTPIMLKGCSTFIQQFSDLQVIV